MHLQQTSVSVFFEKEGDRTFYTLLGLMTFYQFIASSRGAQLMEILMLGGMPTPQVWSHYDNWWITTRAGESVDGDDNSPTWITSIMWKSKLFMSNYWSLANKLVSNPFVLTVEEMVWSLHTMAQVKIC